MLLVAEVGVIDPDNPVSVKVVVDTVVSAPPDAVVAFTTCNTLPPPAAAAHLRPVLVELSATNRRTIS